MFVRRNSKKVREKERGHGNSKVHSVIIQTAIERSGRNNVTKGRNILQAYKEEIGK